MPAKHSERPAGPARIILSGAAAVLVLLVVWVAARAVGPAQAARVPSLVMPPAVSPLVSPSPSPLVTSPSPTASPSPSHTRSRSSHTPSRTRTSSPSPTARRTSALSVTVSVRASWEQGYVAMVRVRNTGTTARTWSVTVTHSADQNITLRYTWNAKGHQSGDSFTFTGGPLAAGASFDFGFQTAKTGRGNAHPAACTVVGGKCVVS